MKKKNYFNLIKYIKHIITKNDWYTYLEIKKINSLKSFSFECDLNVKCDEFLLFQLPYALHSRFYLLYP